MLLRTSYMYYIDRINLQHSMPAQPLATTKANSRLLFLLHPELPKRPSNLLQEYRQWRIMHSIMVVIGWRPATAFCQWNRCYSFEYYNTIFFCRICTNNNKRTYGCINLLWRWCDGWLYVYILLIKCDAAYAMSDCRATMQRGSFSFMAGDSKDVGSFLGLNKIPKNKYKNISIEEMVLVRLGVLAFSIF